MNLSAFERVLFYMGAYVLVEIYWTALFKQDQENGGSVFRPTVDGNSSPLAAPLYGLAGVLVLETYQSAAQIPQLSWWMGMLLRSLFFPVIMWLIEIVIGALLWYPPRWFFKKTLKGEGLRAWHYQGKWALCNQFIDLRMYAAWAGFWPIIELGSLHVRGLPLPF